MDSVILVKETGAAMKKLNLYTFLLCFGLAGQAFAASGRNATLHVAVVVPPAARLEVQSATELTVRVTMYPNVEALVWMATGACGVPDNPKVISTSGIHQLSFSPEQAAGKDRFCLLSGDAILKTSALLPQ